MEYPKAGDRVWAARSLPTYDVPKHSPGVVLRVSDVLPMAFVEFAGPVGNPPHNGPLWLNFSDLEPIEHVAMSTDEEYHAFDPSGLDGDPPPKTEPDDLDRGRLSQPDAGRAEGSDRYHHEERVVVLGHDEQEDGRAGFIDVCDADGTPGVMFDDADSYTYVNDEYLYHEP